MAQITIEVPEPLAERIASVRDRLPEVLAYGLDQLSPVPNEVYRYILEFLASNPSPEEIRSFRPTPQMQERISELLEKSRRNQLTSAESSELDEYERIEHVIRMLKIRSLTVQPAS
jgi:hypothetical protein